MNVTGPAWRRPISTASALLPLRAPPSSNVSAPVDTVAECTAACRARYRCARSQDPAKSGESPALTRNGEAASPADESGRLALRATTRPSRQGRLRGDAAGFLSSNSMEEPWL